MKKMVKSLILTVVAVLSTTVVSSVEAISSDEAVQSALARVPGATVTNITCLLYTSPSPRDPKTSRMPSSA